jgi:hypothetical protein
MTFGERLTAICATMAARNLDLIVAVATFSGHVRKWPRGGA